MTVEDLIDEMISQVGAAGDLEDTDLRLAMLNGLKSSLRKMPLQARDKGMRAKSTASLAAAAQSVAVPAGTREIIQVFIQTGGARYEVFMPGLTVFNSCYNSNGSARPVYYIVRGSTVEFNTPADQAYTVSFETFIEIDDIDEATDLTFTSDVLEIVKDGAKATYYLGYEEDEAKHGIHNEEFKSGCRRLDAKYLREEYPDSVQEG